MPLIYYLLRHGSTNASIFERNFLSYRFDLSKKHITLESKVTVQNIANYLKRKSIKHYYTSPYQRCLDTADIVAKITGGYFQTEYRLRDYGVELPFQFIKRSEYFLELTKKLSAECVAIYTHGANIGVLSALLTKGKADIRDIVNYPKNEVLTVIQDGKVEKIDFK